MRSSRIFAEVHSAAWQVTGGVGCGWSVIEGGKILGSARGIGGDATTTTAYKVTMKTLSLARVPRRRHTYTRTYI